MKFYQKTIKEVLSEMEVPDAGRGLAVSDVKYRREKFGLNQIETKSTEGWYKILWRQVKNPLVYILAIAGSVTILLQDFTDAIIIALTLGINISIGFYQEQKMSREISSLNSALAQKATVIRDGRQKEIDAKNLVPGDIIVLKIGDMVPADARLIKTTYLKVNEAALTGEWLPQQKKSEVINQTNVPLGDRENMVFLGTLVEEGKGLAVVTGTGFRTQMGKIAGYVRGVKKDKTVFEKRLSKLSHLIGILVAFVSLLIIFLGILSGKDFFEMFLVGVAIAVSAIPESLPIVITVILVIGAKGILKKRGLVRRLKSVETLGSTTIICTDKTGTLTEGKMQVVKILTGTNELLRQGNGFSKINQNGDESHITVLKIVLLANEATIENPQDDLANWIVRGRPTDRALLTAGIGAGLDQEKLQQQYIKIDELPFDSSRKYYLGLYHHQNHNTLFSVGAPEVLIKKSVKLDLDGKIVKLDRDRKKKLLKQVDDLGKQGLRVLAVGYRNFLNREVKKIEGSLDNDGFGLTFVGLVALKDPLRPDVKKNIKIAQKAGLSIVMVTGDHALTARAIAAEIGLEVQDDQIMVGQEIAKASPKEMSEMVKKIKIFARVEPADKLKIVRAFQDNGEVVAMTGDGVNDTPALKRADIGLALGSGTDAAVQTADLVMLNDSFSIIVAAIRQGRIIFDNIKKTLAYLLSDSLSEIILVAGSIIFALPLPILPAQILWINLVSDSLPGMALALEKGEKDVMKRKPRGKKTRLFDAEIKFIVFAIGIFTNLLLFGIFCWYFKESFNIEYIRTVIFAALGLDSLLYIFACKSLRKNIWQIDIFHNRLLWFSVFFGLATVLAGVYIPVLQTLLKTQSLALFDWVIVGVLALVDLFFIELAKWIFIKFKKV